MIEKSDTRQYIDNLVFVILKRTMTELRIKPRVNNKKYDTLKGAVKLCSDSRKHHINENYYENISYWPGDMGISFHEYFVLLFFARIITNVMPIDKLHINYSSMKLLREFDNKLYSVIKRVLVHGDFCEEHGFLIKYGEELGYAILACQDIGEDLHFGGRYTPNSQSLFFNMFYQKHIKELQPNTFLI